MVYTYADLYKLTYEQLLELDLIAEKSAQNLLEAINNSKNTKLPKFLNALGIRLVGKESADILAQNFKDIEALKAANVEDLSAIDGIGEKMAKSIYDYFHNEQNLKTLDEVLKLGLVLENTYRREENLKFKGLSFVLTGTLEEFSRDKAQEILKSLGAKTPNSVSKNTDYVIAGANAGSKLTKAQNLGIKILSEQEFKELISDKEDL